jgi:probable O-glycosylation ligase (exosortase A-associated)
MTFIFAYTVFIGTMAVSLFRPWMGIVVYYLLAIWSPISIWPWIFGQFRVSYYIALSIMVGFVWAALSGRINFSALRNRQNLFVLVLWASFIVSYFFNPYGTDTTRAGIEDPDYLVSNMSKVFLFYFVTILSIDNKQKLHFLIWVILFTAIHFTYWGNMEYLEGRMMGLHHTLMGPGYKYVVSVWVDENTFALFFVVAIPFLYFMGNYYKNWVLKGLLWLTIPFAWHCIFLTASRGGMLGLFVVTLYIIIRSRSKLFSAVIPALLIIAIIYQSGQVLKMRAESAINVEEDASAQNRFNSWEAGIKMMLDQPITGVGIGNFTKAYPDYSDTAVLSPIIPSSNWALKQVLFQQ